jgi:hypothetical protein
MSTTKVRPLGEIVRSTDREIERIKNYIDKGPIGRFNIEAEFKFIKINKEVTRDMWTSGYIDDVQYQAEMMTLAARELRLRCYQTEMFERCWL